MGAHPLNGTRRMTKEEAKARRRFLAITPIRYHRNLKRRRAWYAKNRDRVNARRRELYAAANPERHEALLVAQRARRATYDKSKTAEKQREYYLANRDRILARQKERDKRPDVKAKHDAILARRKERFHTDPVFREKIRAQKRAQENRRRYSEAGRRKELERHLIPHWTRVASEGPKRIALYLKLTNARNRAAFMKWYADHGKLIDAKLPTQTVNPFVEE